MKRRAAVVAVLISVGLGGRAEAEQLWDVVEEEGTPDPDTAAEPAVAEAQNDADDRDFSLWSRDTLQWKGYYEHQTNGFQLPRQRTNPQSSGWDVMMYNRLRVDLSARPTPGFRVNANIIARSFHGSTRYDLRDMLARSFDGQLDGLAAVDPSSLQFDLQDEIFLDHAYFTADAGPLRLRVGKQPLRFGAGYLWNPTDPFNAKDLLDPTYEVTGITALRMQLFLPHEGLLEALVLPHKPSGPLHAERMAVALRARVAVGRWVVATSYARLQDVVGVDPTSFATVQARRSLFGLELTGEVAGVGLWGEAAFNRTGAPQGAVEVVPFGDPSCPLGEGELCWIEAVGGARYTLDGGVSVQAEVLYNGRGVDRSASLSLWDWFAYLEQTVRTLGRLYATGMLELPLRRWPVTLTAMAVSNISDGSVLLSPWVQWDWSQELAVTLYGALSTWNDATDEFRATGRAAYLRFRFSF